MTYIASIGVYFHSLFFLWIDNNSENGDNLPTLTIFFINIIILIIIVRRWPDQEVEAALQDEGRRGLVHQFAPARARQVRLVQQQPLGRHRRKSLVPERHRQVEMPGEVVGELAARLGARPLRAVLVQRQTDDNAAHRLPLPEGGQALRGFVESLRPPHHAGRRGYAPAGVGEGDADLPIADIEADQTGVTWQPGQVGGLANPCVLARDEPSPPRKTVC